MAIAPTLETPRLILRQQHLDDFERYWQLFGNERAARYVGGALPRAGVWRRFLQMPGAWALQGFGMFSVAEKRSGRWIGQAGPWQPDGWPGTEIGYALHPDAWGNGYATEACVAATDWAFDALGWTHVIHCIDVENTASQAVARRLGSRVLRRIDHAPPFDDLVIDVWGQSRQEWQTNRQALLR